MEDAPERVHIFGIRHHGPGSARSLKAALDALRPDAVLVEGPPDADELLPLALNSAMQPPVALLIYPPDEPTYSAYYPFAEYSPEWQAIRWGLANQVPLRMIDLPQSVQMALAFANASPAQIETQELPQEKEPSAVKEPADRLGPSDRSGPGAPASEEESTPELYAPPGPAAPDDFAPAIDTADPLRLLAEAAGYGDSEQWWERLVEQYRGQHWDDDPGRAAFDLFAAILEAMTAIREALPPETHPIAARREAAMRQSIRAVLYEGCQRVAVVCGAWHAPALVHLEDAAADTNRPSDDALLDGLPEIDVRATWVPWSNARLTRRSGYGAGIDSPGWYGHLWATGDGVVPRWMIRVARLLRDEDLDIAPAHVIEAVRLAEALAALRDHPLPGLAELNEAALTVFCSGSPLPMHLIEEKLIVGDVLGCVPPETPMAPLQQDFDREIRRLKLAPEAYEKLLDLDLRRPIDLERSYLLHRLNLLEIPWGRADAAALQSAGHGRSGTFHEIWRIKWQPDLAVLLIDAGQWGSTIAEAAAARVCQLASRALDLVALTGMVEDVLLAELPTAIRHVMNCLQAQAAVSSDMRLLMQALPPLASVLRYGNVRQTDSAMIAQVVEGLAARVCIGLPGACSALNDDAAAEIFDLLLNVEDAFNRLSGDSRPDGSRIWFRYRQDWQRALAHLLDLPNIHGLIAGRACRVLYDAGQVLPDEAARRLGLALSTANDPLQSAAWIEGFLRGSGQLLVHDDELLGVLNDWLSGLAEEIFIQLLPLLRRTFSTFAYPERRSIGERVKQYRLHSAPAPDSAPNPNFDLERAEAVLPLVSKLLGISRSQVDD